MWMGAPPSPAAFKAFSLQAALVCDQLEETPCFAGTLVMRVGPLDRVCLRRSTRQEAEYSCKVSLPLNTCVGALPGRGGHAWGRLRLLPTAVTFARSSVLGCSCTDLSNVSSRLLWVKVCCFANGTTYLVFLPDSSWRLPTSVPVPIHSF